MKKFVSCFLMSCVLMGQAWATDCPSSAALRSGQFFIALPQSNGTYSAINLGKFGTEKTWAFVIGNIEAQSIGEGIKKANRVLQTVHGEPASQKVKGKDVCLYGVRHGFLAAAVSKTSNTEQAAAFVSQLR